jgi:hypothetical protein
MNKDFIVVVIICRHVLTLRKKVHKGSQAHTNIYGQKYWTTFWSHDFSNVFFSLSKIFYFILKHNVTKNQFFVDFAHLIRLEVDGLNVEIPNPLADKLS